VLLGFVWPPLERYVLRHLASERTLPEPNGGAAAPQRTRNETMSASFVSGSRPPLPADLKYRADTPGVVELTRRGLKRVLAQASDRAWLGLTPLRTHVVICGFPRSGSTLLLLMAETAFPHARTYHQEKTGIKAARQFWPGRASLMITKRPNDIFWVDEIRGFYRARQTAVRFIVTARDPRAVLTSTHEEQAGYYVTPERWRAMFAHFEYVRRAPDVLTVDFNDLVRQPQTVQERLTTFIGWEAAASFEQFHARIPTDFDTAALNGVRPLDPRVIDRWKGPQHRERVRQILQALPELPEVLMDLGYEDDTSWTEAYT